MKVTLSEQITNEKRLSICRDFYTQLKKKTAEEKGLMEGPPARRGEHGPRHRPTADIRSLSD